MKCPNCKRDLKVKYPPALAKEQEITCPHCNTILLWKWNWARGLVMAIVACGLFYLLGIVLGEKTFIIAFPIAGFILGLVAGARILAVK